MKYRLFSLFVFFAITSLIVSGCALEHHGRFAITNPHTNNTFSQTDHINVTLHRYSPIDPYHYFRYQIRDNGTVILASEARGEMSDIQYILNGESIGTHLIDARAQAFDSANVHSDWYPATSICIYVGPNPPSNFTCDIVYGWPAHDEFVPVTPVLTIATEAPPVTPLIIIRPNSNGNSNGNNSGGKPSASGCAAYTDQSSCNLAGCSWSSGSCIVNP